MHIGSRDQWIFEVGQPTGIPGIRRLESHRPGPHVGLMGMLHGNEHAGLGIWDFAKQIGAPARGCVYLIVGHPEAFLHPDKPVRYIDHDLNRLFRDDLTQMPSQHGIEQARCLALQGFFPKLDVLIDIHSTSSDSEPFVVIPGESCDHKDLALDLPITHLHRLDDYLSRTATSWMTRRGKAGLMIEVGQHAASSSRSIAADLVCHLLKQLKMIEPSVTIDQTRGYHRQRHIWILRQTRVEGHHFGFVRPYRNFDSLAPGEIIARDTKRDYVAPDLDRLVLCMPTAADFLRNHTGSEAYYIGVEHSSCIHALLSHVSNCQS